ncbi:hypothetical protein AN478_10590 [Thiohalorhabdus denitrificans]|nr:hypothetical protein AN478_10590 [Thiohalorhabdus denitrificans]
MARLALALMPLLISGCAYTTGIQSVAQDESQWYGEGGPEGEGGAPPEIIPINPETLLEMRRKQVQEGDDGERTFQERMEEYQYRVGPDDVLNIVVWNHPELSNPMGQFQDIEQMGQQVSKDGTIFFPFVGEVRVAGRTTGEIRETIAEGLAPYIESPQVGVRVVAFRSKKVYVTGKVNEPGIQPITNVPLTVMDAINQAGGMQTAGQGGGGSGGGGGSQSYGADQRTAILTRDGQQHRIDLLELYSTGEGNRLLRDGDVLYVPDNSDNKVFVLGEFNEQSSVLMHQGEMTLAEAVAQAKGFDSEAAYAYGLYVIRGVPQETEEGGAPRIKPKVFHLDARAAASMVLADQFQLQPRDVVYVATSGLVRWNRLIGQILPTVRAAYQLRILSEGFDIE